jgi:replicative DNA helicase
MLSDLRECVTGDTLVTLADGRRLPIEQLVGETPRVLAVDENDRIVKATSDKVWKVGRRPILRMRLASGLTLRGTADHRVRTGAGWRKLGELGANDLVAVARDVQEQLTSLAPSDRSRQPSAPGPAVGVLDRPEVRRQESDLAFEVITEVKPAGEEDVFDLTVPGPACWLADGIVTHNSGQIEQDADVVMFVYRDEYYNQESDRLGEADIIVAKHRNGPISPGDGIPLTFLPKYPRFTNMYRERGGEPTAPLSENGAG